MWNTGFLLLKLFRARNPYNHIQVFQCKITNKTKSEATRIIWYGFFKEKIYTFILVHAFFSKTFNVVLTYVNIKGVFLAPPLIFFLFMFQFWCNLCLKILWIIWKKYLQLFFSMLRRHITFKARIRRPGCLSRWNTVLTNLANLKASFHDNR